MPSVRSERTMRSHDSAIPPRLGGKLSVSQSGRARSRVTEPALVGVVVVEVAHVVVGVVVAVRGPPERRVVAARVHAVAQPVAGLGRAGGVLDLLGQRLLSGGGLLLLAGCALDADDGIDARRRVV